MLDRNIQIVADLFFLTDSLNELIGDLLRIAVLNPDPVDARDLSQLMKQLGSIFFPYKSTPYRVGLLRYQDQLSDTLVSQLLPLSRGAPSARCGNFPQAQDDAVSTVFITAFRDL